MKDAPKRAVVSEDGSVVVDSADPEPLATTPRDTLVKVLSKMGYPPTKELHGQRGSSGHWQRDNEKFADNIIEALAGEGIQLQTSSFDVEVLATTLGDWVRTRRENCNEASPCDHDRTVAEVVVREYAALRDARPGDD